MILDNISRTSSLSIVSFYNSASFTLLINSSNRHCKYALFTMYSLVGLKSMVFNSS